MKTLKVRLTLTEEALGMMPTSKEVHEEFIASKAPDAPSIEEEVEAVGVEEVVEKQKTVFPRMDDGTLFFWDYQLRGMVKDAIGMLRKVTNTARSKVTSYKKAVDGLIFVKEPPGRRHRRLPEAAPRLRSAGGPRRAGAQRDRPRRELDRVHLRDPAGQPGKGGAGVPGLRPAAWAGPVAQQRQRPLLLGGAGR